MKVIASWDDAAAGDTRIAELMKKYNVPTIFYWPIALEKSQNVARVGKFLTMDQCKELAKEFEVGSHTVNHVFLTKVNLQQARNEVFDSRKQWQDLTGQEIKSFCYPRGYTNTMIKMLVKNAGYETARSVAIGNLTSGDDPYFIPTTVHIGIDRVEYKGVSWEIYARRMLEEAQQKPDAIYHLFGHSWEIDRENDWDALESLLKELT